MTPRTLRSGLLCLTGSLALAGGSWAIQARGDTETDARLPRWRILVTNDDGIGTDALAALVHALSKTNDVVVCAPDGNRSGSSHSISLSRAMTIKEAAVAEATRAIAVGGSPADAVSYGLQELAEPAPFDLVISGINQGANVGDLSHMSGTVGSAMQAVYRGVPAIAVSQGRGRGGFEFAAEFTARFVSTLKERGARPGVVYSINVPPGGAEALKGVAIRPMGGSYLTTDGWASRRTEEGEDGVAPRLRLQGGGPEGSDTKAFLDGHITITPLQFDWTDRSAIEELSDWSLSVK